MQTDGQMEMLNAKPSAASARRTTAVGDWTERASDDVDDRKSRDCPKLEALKQIYDQICAIRHSHAQIVAENAAKRAEVRIRTTDPSILVRFVCFLLLLLNHGQERFCTYTVGKAVGQRSPKGGGRRKNFASYANMQFLA